jgi:metal-sulfur cluster biosynthetic enzyme
MLMTRLTNVIDPEVGLNVVDMGLIYGVELKDEVVHVTMTLTTPGCPMQSYMRESVVAELGSLQGVKEVRVEFVFTPPWSPSKIKPEALEALRSGRPYP